MIHQREQKNRDGYQLFQKYKRKELPFLQTTCFNCYTCTGVFSDEQFWPCFVRPKNGKTLRAYVVSVMDNSLFQGRTNVPTISYPIAQNPFPYFKSRFVFALQLNTNIHTIMRRNDDDDCYCYYYCYYLLFVLGEPQTF